MGNAEHILSNVAVLAIAYIYVLSSFATCDNTTVTSSTTSLSPASTTKGGRINNVCDPNYQPAGMDEHECFLPFCIGKGVCRIGDKGPECHCDPGTTTSYCDPCCADCGLYGKCVIDLTEEETCSCPDYLEGDNCEKYVGRTLCEPSAIYYHNFLPLSLRECSDNLTCVHGICNTTSSSEPFCDCHRGAYGETCDYICCVDCGRHGTCFRDPDTGNDTCVCSDSYSGERCDVPPPPEKETWYWYVVVACVVVLVILLLLMIVVPYFMWKHRVILVMKVVHYFQGYEDDDEREWDAFISYKDDCPDAEFVVNILVPKLSREMGFNINVHYITFVPGETIMNGIINAVEKSRRTIMVVSPHYLTSNFTRFEWETAQKKMLERKHRIIPILLEDISGCKDTMDENLKLILNSVTYIQWPGADNPKEVEKFWKRIELSMPKKKNRSSSNQNMQNYSTSNGITNNGFSNSDTSPESVSITMDGNSNSKIRTAEDLSKSGVYNTIREQDVGYEPEEVYDTLNELEMEPDDIENKLKDKNCLNLKPRIDTKTENNLEPKKDNPTKGDYTSAVKDDSKQKQHEYLNILRIDL